MALLDVVEWRDTTGTEIVHRWPEYGDGNIRLGSQLVVRESQAAVFFRDGKALDVFGPGRHTLTTGNLPLLGSLINLPFGGHTPFQAEVYFVNLRTFTDLKWGTRAPVVFRDKELAMVRLRAFGLYTCRVGDVQLFVNKVVGTEQRYTQDAVSTWMRDFIVARFTDCLGEVIQTILDLPQNYDEIGVAVRERVRSDFDKYGLELTDLLIEAITPPEAVQKLIDQRSGMEVVGDMDRYTRFQTAQAIGQMGAGGAPPRRTPVRRRRGRGRRCDAGRGWAGSRPRCGSGDGPDTDRCSPAGAAASHSAAGRGRRLRRVWRSAAAGRQVLSLVRKSGRVSGSALLCRVRGRGSRECQVLCWLRPPTRLIMIGGSVHGQASSAVQGALRDRV